MYGSSLHKLAREGDVLAIKVQTSLLPFFVLTRTIPQLALDATSIRMTRKINLLDENKVSLRRGRLIS